jgi:hypothetical protein
MPATAANDQVLILPIDRHLYEKKDSTPERPGIGGVGFNFPELTHIYFARPALN